MLAASAGAWAGCVSVAACTGQVVKERHRPASGEGLAAWVGEASAGYTAEKAAEGGVKGLCGGFAGRSALLYSLQREGQDLRGQQFPQQAVPELVLLPRDAVQGAPSKASLLRQVFFLYVLNVFSIRRKIN